MSFNTEIVEKLQAPLERKNVKQRSQSGFNLSYIEGHHAIREANRIFGHDGWNRKTCDLNLVQCEEKTFSKNGKEVTNWYVSYTARSLVTVGEVTREGIGFGQGIDKDLGKAHESAIKEAETDAMKRALMTFGDPFGLALYDKDQSNVVSTPREYQFPGKEATAKKKAETLGVDWGTYIATCKVKNITTPTDALALMDEMAKVSA